MTDKPTIGKYIDPMVDYGFKVIFKESGKKQLIIRPLNEIFDLDIVDIEIVESEQLGLTEEERKASYDMHCKTLGGEEFIIEVQLARQDYFMERAIFYSALTVAHEAERGAWNYHLHPVFFLGFLNFDIRHLDPARADPSRFIHKFSLREDETHEQMSPALRFAFLEVARFDKQKDACLSFEDRFLYMMKNLPTFAEKPELWDDPYFLEMMNEAEFANMTTEQRIAYAQAMKNKWDYQNTINYARKEGREEGRAEGRAEGKAEGILEGKKEQSRETARQMLAEGLPVELVARCTKLTEEEIRTL